MHPDTLKRLGERITNKPVFMREYAHVMGNSGGNLKEYWTYLSASFDDPHKVFKKVKKVNTFDEYEEAVLLVFGEHEWLGSDNTQV